MPYKVSIIVPVYNVEKYLKSCLRSILEQRLSDIEIICVDDGSTDHSGRILDEFAACDKRIKVVHKENAGYGVAMNVGLELATGEYIGIVESDDRIAPAMYEELYRKASENNLDFVKSEAFFWFEELDYIRRIHYKNMEQYFDQVLGERDRNIFFDFFMNIWTGIYKRDFLIKNGIRFNESSGASYQDNGFWMQTCLYAQKAMWLNKAYYYYRQDNPMASIKSRDKMLAMSKEYEYVETILMDRHQEELLPYCYSMKLYRHRGNYFRIADDLKLKFTEQLQSDYDKYKVHIRCNQYLDRWMRDYLKDPKAYTNDVIAKKETIISQITNAGHVIIYGVGSFGDRTLRVLYNENLFQYIDCFAVSGEPEMSSMASKPLLNIEKVDDKNTLVLLAVASFSIAQYEMIKTLERLGFKNILRVTDFMDYFYVL